jgi:GNAT superfamily N-acetyltransferase
MSNLQVCFTAQAPSRTLLNTFFQQTNPEFSEGGVAEVIAYRPHPALTPMWATLKNEAGYIGIATMYLPPKPAIFAAPVFIGNFVIDEAFRRQGSGAYFLQALQNFCQQRNLKKLALEFTSESCDFWKSQGFVKNGQFPTLLFKEI